MAIFTAEQKAEQIASWHKALLAVSKGQEYTIGTRTLRRADLPEIRKTLDWLEEQPTVEEEAVAGRTPRFYQCIPGRGGRGSY